MFTITWSKESYHFLPDALDVRFRPFRPFPRIWVYYSVSDRLIHTSQRGKIASQSSYAEFSESKSRRYSGLGGGNNEERNLEDWRPTF